MVVTLEHHGSIGVITIDNPPVNATSQAVRAGLVAALSALTNDPGLVAGVLRCAGRTFIAGADLREFGQPSAPPILPDVVGALERSEKPIVAAIHGTALGGGLEIALGCHGRVATRDAKLGFPEVHVGVIPGAGGTQRLPRLIGIAAAIDMITSGTRIDAKAAYELALVDRIADGDIDAAAIEFAAQIVGRAAPAGRRDEAPLADDGIDWEQITRTVTEAARGLSAPLCALEAIRAATTMPLADGLARERAIFAECRDSREGRALRHAFFAERRAARDDGGAPPLPVAQVGIIGAGTMGRGIAQCFASAGMSVKLVDNDDETLATARGAIEAIIDGEAAKARIDADLAAARKSGITYTSEPSTLTTCDLVIEAIFEDLAIKIDLFRRVGPALKPDAILASNTSYLDIAELASASGRADRVIGLHFFSPAHLMKLVEVVVPETASPAAVATGFAVTKRLGKSPVRAGNAHGFIGNRIWSAYRRQADYLVADGASPSHVDAAMREFGFRMGPFAAHDLAGLDVGLAMRRQWRDANPDRRQVDLADRLCAMGRFGQKAGAGWYRYEAGDRTPHPDPLVEHLIEQAARENGRSRTPIDQKTIQRRLLVAMVNEACHVLAAGVARRPSDIDVVFLNGYGFPRAHGGPLFWADEVGAGRLADWLDDYSLSDPTAWEPSAMLRDMARTGRRFAELDAD